jgi:isoleucyl-tRNA synthetase
MKYKHGTRRKAAEYEKDIAEQWKKNRTFEKSVEQRSEDNAYVFYDGPPFISGMPHHGHLLGSTVKDAVARYWTMKGKRVERVWGWDCHGLPAENFAEKHMNGTVSRKSGGKPDELILKSGDETKNISLEEYITTTRDLMVDYTEKWETYVDRIGRWVDFKGAYRTMDKDFMESVWWAFKELYDKGKIYEGEKVLMYDTKFATPVSKNEVTMDNDAYRTVTDPSVYVKFKQVPGQKCHNDEWTTGDDTYFLAWTTTPWTLPANMALAVGEDTSYSEVKVDGGDELYIVATDRLEDVFKGHEIEVVYDDVKGSDLIGLEYVTLFPEVSASVSNKTAHKVYAADYVETDMGTGIIHLAPAYGEIDFEFAQEKNIPVLHAIDDNGYYLPGFAAKLEQIGVKPTDETGIEVWAANKFIAKCLEEQGKVWKIEYIQHEYPFNPRSKQRIMYRAIPSWFFDIQGQKPLMLSKNENINWFPPHLKHGRFAKNIDQAPDWTLSRNRFWATAMPVWKGDKGTVKVVGSYAELEKLSGQKLDDYHRPWVDKVEFDINDEHFTRIEEVLDCWFESGSMPFAQFHYPFENKEKFEANYPADFITEYMPQVRAWFYYVHTVNTALFGDQAFQNVIVTGTIAGEDGRKMSKSLGNYTDPMELMDKFSADSLRFLLASSPLLSGEDFSLKDKDVSDVARKLAMIWNMYDFFTMYAEVDGWEYAPANAKLDLKTIKSEFNLTVNPRGYIGIEITDLVRSLGFPPEIKNMKLKDNEFHISLTQIPLEIGEEKISEIEKASLEAAPELLAETPKLTGEFFLAREGEKETIIATINFPTLEKWRAKVKKVYPKVEFHFPHTTLYKNEAAGKGIPISSREVFENLTEKLDDESDRILRNAFEKNNTVFEPQNLTNPLDKWIVSRVHELRNHITKYLDEYNLPDAMSAILPMVDDASNWYVRRSRRRFWKSEDDGDKNDAYRTLHYVLVYLSQILAPFVPFLAEELYQKLTGGESVHLLDWPNAGEIDEKVLSEMARTREIIEKGLAQRMDREDEFGQIKVRQPLAKLTYGGEKLDDFYEQIITDEVNVKRVEYAGTATDEIALDKILTPELRREGAAREIIRLVQNARKSAGLNVDDRIKLALTTTDAELTTALTEYRDVIAIETLATEITDKLLDKMYQTTAKVDDAELKIALIKSNP